MVDVVVDGERIFSVTSIPNEDNPIQNIIKIIVGIIAISNLLELPRRSSSDYQN